MGLSTLGDRRRTVNTYMYAIESDVKVKVKVFGL